MRGSTFLGTAWHGWFHVVGNTYGTWISGDSRGFRTRHHRQHVDGDYKDPPLPGVYDALRFCSERAMNQSAVVLRPAARFAACTVLAEALRHHQVDLLEVAVTANHYHILARFPCTPQWIARISNAGPALPASVGRNRHDRRHRRSALDDPPRHYVGIAKKESSRVLSRAGLVAPGRTWAKRCKPLPVEDRAHQVEVVRYLRKHVTQGAAVLSLLESPP